MVKRNIYLNLTSTLTGWLLMYKNQTLYTYCVADTIRLCLKYTARDPRLRNEPIVFNYFSTNELKSNCQIRLQSND